MACSKLKHKFSIVFVLQTKPPHKIPNNFPAYFLQMFTRMISTFCLASVSFDIVVRSNELRVNSKTPVSLFALLTIASTV